MAAALGLLGGGGGSRAASLASGMERFYIGTYTSGSSLGIYQSTLDLAARTMGVPALAGSAGNPSWVVLHPAGNFLYAVDESGGLVMAFSVDRATGLLSRLNQQSSGGAAPCHLAVDRAGKNLLVANYTGGTVVVFPILDDGRLGARTARIQHPGTAPHPHCVAFDDGGRFAWVCDLGLDRIYAYRFDATGGTLTEHSTPWTSTPPGAGPRHLAFDPRYQHAYVICELNSTLIAYGLDAEKGILTEVQTLSSLPDGWRGRNSTAEIAVHPTGGFVYASNRGHNSVAVFSRDPATGRLALVQHQSVGQVPRHFAIDPTGAFCLVANQDSDDVRLYAIDPPSGRLTPTGQAVSVSKPVCILPVLTQAPRPLVTVQASARDSFDVSLANAVGSLAYQLEQSSELSAGGAWTRVATGSPGQTRFTLSNAGSCGFLRASILPNP